MVYQSCSKSKFLFLLFAVFIAACTQQSEENAEAKLLLAVSSAESGVNFENRIEETVDANYYKYMYTYIGGGVGAADFNKDGLEDLFFVSNSFDNKLYLNRGDFKFEDVTDKAGITNPAGFDAGVAIADVNNDGFPDIYVTRGGWIQEGNRFANLLYINNGLTETDDGTSTITFTESAEALGLADDNRSIAATFFDYDKDGDLDVYIANSPDFEDRAAAIVDLETVKTDPRTFELKGSDKLYQNDGTGHFADVSESAGILPDIGFGLNPQVCDLNQDGWLDVYVCNDFRIPDFAYLNNGDGTFSEARDKLLKHMSFNSMGSDVADMNNDGFFDLFTLDMNPEDYVRSKTTMGMTPLDRFEEMVEKDYHYNYMHNMLQLNNGNGTFREIANMAGVANTDWSWASLLADFDLDGLNDIYITNGVFRDVIDRDANNRILQVLRERGRKPTDEDFLEYTKMLPQQKLTNYIFKNLGDLTFENVSASWTDSVPGFSNGATYADLDNDGDLDIVVNNINSEALILKNNAIEFGKGNFLQFDIVGPDRNKNGIGTVLKINLPDGTSQVRQVINTRGFLSSVSNKIHFGLGNNESISSLEILWPDGKKEERDNVAANQLIAVDYEQASLKPADEETSQTTLFSKTNSTYYHSDPSHNDYDLQILLPHKLSQTGPAVAKADVNGDGLEDIYLGGGHRQAGQLLLASTSGKYVSKAIPAFLGDRQKEDVAAAFFDADNDQDLDLYVVSGSYEFYLNPRQLLDRLYLNDGKGNFEKAVGRIPEISTAGAVVKPADFDGDGDIDLFIGSRVIPGNYPYAPTSFLLENEQGNFQIVTESLAPALEKIGMINDAVWEDLENDGDLDLILTGEWMGIEVFVNEKGQFSPSDQYGELSNAKGWWNKLLIEDIDQDGDKDIIAGNLGLNYKIHASPEKPFHIYTHDFDYNGSADVILAKNYKGMEVPVRGKTCATMQIPHLAQKIPTYNQFANSDLEGILGPAVKSALHYEATEFRSGIFVNDGEGDFQFSPFDNFSQQSPINSMIYEDFNDDGIKDILMAGNNYMSEIETTRSDAGIGVFLKGIGGGQFKNISHLESGFFADKDVRNMIQVKTSKGVQVWVINNNEQHDVFESLGRLLE